ncbi:hypothetical protein DRP04_10315, partial [Archaeoglobales archaeon]
MWSNEVPAEGYTYDGSVYFWVPDVWIVYHENASIEVTYLRILVFDEEFNITVSPSTEDLYLQVAYVQIIVKDKEPVAQPLMGAKVEIYYEGEVLLELAPGMTKTVTTEGGYVLLPPYHGSIWVASEDLDKYTTYFPGGYLPIPVGKDNEVYTVKVYWTMPNLGKWVDVTDYNNNTITVYLDGCRTIPTWLVLANVYEAHFKILDYCDEPLTIKDFPYAEVKIYYNGDLAFVTSPGSYGEIHLHQIIAGEYSFKLYWKYALLPSDNGTVTIEGNILEKELLYFPVVDVKFETYMWDVKEPFNGINATIYIYDEEDGIYKQDIWNGWIANKTGNWVLFKKIPANVTINIVIKVSEDAPYVRPEDYGALIFNLTAIPDDIKANLPQELGTGKIVVYKAEKPCTVVREIPVYVYSFNLCATDCTGEPLKGTIAYDESIGEDVYYNVTVLLNETSYVVPICCPPSEEIYYIYSLINVTSPYDAPACFKYYSRQNPTYPHVFIGGQEYHWKVFYLGTLVYNYTVTLPLPWETTTEYINETAITDKKYIYHELYSFEGMEVPWSGDGTELIKLKLYSWVVPIKMYATTISAAIDGFTEYTKTVPNVKIEIGLDDVLNATFTNNTANWDELADDTESTWTFINLTLYGYTSEEDGSLTILIPVWTPKSNGHANGIYFGDKISSIELYGASDYGTPGFVDNIGKKLINYNNDTDPATYPGVVPGFNWNITMIEEGKTEGVKPWCGAWVVLPTKIMDHVVVSVKVPTKEGGIEELEKKSVEVYLDSNFVAEGIAENYEPVVFTPPSAGTVTLPNATTLEVIKAQPDNTGAFIAGWTYTFKTTLKYYLEKKLEWTAYNWASDEEAVEELFNFEELSETVELTEDYNCGKTVITLEWGAIIVKVLDWAGQPLVNMTVFALPTSVGAGVKPYVFDITDKSGVAILYVGGSSSTPYYVDVYWRDTYFLEKAGKIPKSINIYASSVEEEAWRYWYPGQFREVKVYVYKVVPKLLKADGSSLSSEALNKITVKITWPDKVVTTHKPKSDGSVNVVLNKDTVVSWPIPYSATFNPNSPAEQPQTPPGAYVIEVYWEGIEEPLYKGTITVEKAETATPLITFEIKLPIYDLAFKAVSPFGTPLSNAEAEVEVPGKGVVKVALDAEGKGVIPEVPTRKATVKSIVWKGTNVLEAPKDITAGATITAAKIGKIVVKVVGQFGQLDSESVTIKGPIEISKKVEGSLEIEVPSGSYTVTAPGTGFSKTVTVPDGGVAEVTISTGRVAGIPFSQLITWIVGIII